MEILDRIRAYTHIAFGASIRSLSATWNVSQTYTRYNRVTAATSQSIVLPDATSMVSDDPSSSSLVREIIFDVQAGSADLVLKTYDAVTPIAIRTLKAGVVYGAILVDGSTQAGTWRLIQYPNADSITVAVFNATTDWGTASGGWYTITLTAAVHEKGIYPDVDVFKISGSDRLPVTVKTVIDDTTGDIYISVPEMVDPGTTDLRFAGIIQVNRS